MLYNSLYTLYIQNPMICVMTLLLEFALNFTRYLFPLLIPFNLPNSMAHLSELLLLQSELANDLSLFLGPIQNRKISKALDK